MGDSASSQRGPTTVSLADEYGVGRILADTLFGLWSIVHNLTRLRPSRRNEWPRRYALRPGFGLAHPEDRAVPRCVDTVEQAVTTLRDHHARWQAAQQGASRAAP